MSACCEREFFASVHYHHSGTRNTYTDNRVVQINCHILFYRLINVCIADADVMRQCRKLELALHPNGWRGNVEEEL